MGYYENMRKQRLDEMKKDIKKKSPISEKKILAQASMTFGITEEKAKEYLSTLENAELIRVDESGSVSWMGE